MCQMSTEFASGARRAVTGLGRMDAVALRLGGVHEVRPADVRRGLAHQGVVELGLRTYLPDVASIAPP